METKLERIADKSAHERRPIFTSLYHLLNEELLLGCHKELDGKKAIGIDEKCYIKRSVKKLRKSKGETT